LNFEDLKDDNGTSLKSYAEVLIEKAKDKGLVTIAIFASKEHGMLHVLTNVDGSVPMILRKLAEKMTAEKSS